MNCEEFTEVSEKKWMFILLKKKMREYDHKYEVRKNLFFRSWWAEKN